MAARVAFVRRQTKGKYEEELELDTVGLHNCVALVTVQLGSRHIDAGGKGYRAKEGGKGVHR